MTPALRGVAIGTGYFSQFHYDAWAREGGVEITAICGRDPVRLGDTAARYGIPRTYADAERMLDEERPDFLDIITPPETHSALVRAAAERGVAVLCQKALAPTYDEAKAIVATARAAGIRFMVHDNFRFQPWHRELRRLIDDGAIGRLQAIGCRSRLGDGRGSDAYLARQPYFQAMPQFLIFETGVHFIDVFRYLAGEIMAVFARTRRLNPAIAGEDSALLFCQFAGGATGLWDADRYHQALTPNPRYTFGSFLIEGSLASLSLGEDGRIARVTGGGTEEHSYRHEDRAFAGDCVAATIRHFVERLRSGAPFELEGDDYLRTLAVQEAAYRSAASGRLETVAG